MLRQVFWRARKEVKWDSRMGQGMVGEYLKRTMCVVGGMVGK